MLKIPIFKNSFFNFFRFQSLLSHHAGRRKNTLKNPDFGADLDLSSGIYAPPTKKATFVSVDKRTIF